MKNTIFVLFPPVLILPVIIIIIIDIIVIIIIIHTIIHIIIHIHIIITITGREMFSQINAGPTFRQQCSQYIRLDKRNFILKFRKMTKNKSYLFINNRLWRLHTPCSKTYKMFYLI